MNLDQLTPVVMEAFTSAFGTSEAECEAILGAMLPDPSDQLLVRQLLARHESLESGGEGFLRELNSELAGALLDGGDELPLAIGRYRVLKTLARGGHGVVYQAEDPDLGRLVAIKVLPPERGNHLRAREQLRAEARTISALDHPHIAAVHEIGETDTRQLYIVMGYYEGETLRQRLAKGPLPVTVAHRIGRELADALATAHASGIVHRDVKPENIILAPNGVRLLDFGMAITAARESATGVVVGTVGYMAPEQVLGAPADPRADVWALGVVLYEALVGRRPFDSSDPMNLLEAIQTSEPAPLRTVHPTVAPGLAAVVDACLKKDPALRPADAVEVRRRLAVATPRRSLVAGVSVGLATLALSAALLLGGGGRAIESPSRPDATAESLYVGAMALLDSPSAANAEQAGVMLRAAINRDSTFARAYAGLARALSQGRVGRPADRYLRTRPLLERAASLDPTLPGVLTELGWIALWYDRDLGRAERLFRQALAQDPTDPWNYHYYAAWLSLIGRIDEAVGLERRAMVVDPRGAATATHVAIHLTWQGKLDEAIALLEEVLTRDSLWARTHSVLGLAYIAAGRHDDGLPHLRRDNYQFGGLDSRAALAYGLGRAGQLEEARQIISEFEQRALAGYVNPVDMVASHIGVGDLSRALDWAERIPDDPGVMWFPRSDLIFKPLVTEPRFQRVLKRLGLDSAAVTHQVDTRAVIDSILGGVR